MIVEPEKLILREEKEEKTSDGKTLKFVYLKINRKSLAFTYKWSYTIMDSSGILGKYITSDTTRKSTGICVRIQEAKGNKK